MSCAGVYSSAEGERREGEELKEWGWGLGGWGEKPECWKWSRGTV